MVNLWGQVRIEIPYPALFPLWILITALLKHEIPLQLAIYWNPRFPPLFYPAPNITAKNAKSRIPPAISMHTWPVCNQSAGKNDAAAEEIAFSSPAHFTQKRNVWEYFVRFYEDLISNSNRLTKNMTRQGKVSKEVHTHKVARSGVQRKTPLSVTVSIWGRDTLHAEVFLTKFLTWRKQAAFSPFFSFLTVAKHEFPHTRSFTRECLFNTKLYM